MPGNLNDRSGSIASGGTAQQIAGANQSRQYILVQNVSDTNMWVNFGVDAVADEPSILLTPGASIDFTYPAVPWGYCSILCATTGKKFVAKEA